MPFMLLFLLALLSQCHHPGDAFALVHNANGRTNPARLLFRLPALAQPAKKKASDEAMRDADGVSEALVLRIHTLIKGYGVRKPAIRKALLVQSITSEADISDATAIGKLSAVISVFGKTKDGKKIEEDLTKEFEAGYLVDSGDDGKSVVAETEQLASSMGELLDRKETPSGEDLKQLKVYQEKVVELLAKLPALTDLSVEERLKISQTLSELKGIADVILKQASQQEAEVSPQQGRVASVDFDILERTMSYRFDLVRFLKNVQDLFQWHENKSIQNEFLAPYFPLIQSSGTGKTKLLYEACKELNAQGNFFAKLILCTNEYEPTPLPSKLKVFTDILTVPSNSKTKKDRDKVIGFLNSIVNAAITVEVDGVKPNKKIVLFFDESQWLTSKNSGYFFLVIRWWLKMIRENTNIVAVFAGTTSMLANYFPEPPLSTTSRDAPIYIQGGEKLYQPFFELTTIGLLANVGSPPNPLLSEYKQAIPYGRPLFACMDQNGLLEDKLLEVMQRMLTSSPNSDDDNYFAILGARVQMGRVSFDMASKLVGNRYAHFTNFESGKKCFADVAFLPDPVCARIAMSQMVEGCTLLDSNEFPGYPPSFWTSKAIAFFSRRLCRPPNGDLGEVAAALYLLFCGDKLRHKVSPDLTHFSISLNDWVQIMDCPSDMAEGGSTSQKSFTSQPESLPGEQAPLTDKTSTLDETSDLKEAAASVNFIQICRNYGRPSLESLSKYGVLEEWYKAGRAVYTHPSCRSYDILAPIRYRTRGSYFYCPLMISVKNCATFSKKERERAIMEMKNIFINEDLKTGVGFLVLVGLEKNQKCLLQRPQQLFVPGKLTFVEIVVPSNDPFGVSSLASVDTGELAEVYISHAEVSLLAQSNQEWPPLLRTSSTARDSFHFLQDMRAALPVSQKQP